MQVYKIVKAEDVERWTSEGWGFVQVIPQVRAQKVECSTPMAPANGYSGAIYGSRDVLVQVHEPLFMLTKAQHILDREQHLTTERDAAEKLAKALQLKIDLLTGRQTLMDQEIAALQVRYNALCATKDAQEQLRHKLEADLAKICTTFGSKAIADALK